MCVRCPTLGLLLLLLLLLGPLRLLPLRLLLLRPPTRVHRYGGTENWNTAIELVLGPGLTDHRRPLSDINFNGEERKEEKKERKTAECCKARPRTSVGEAAIATQSAPCGYCHWELPRTRRKCKVFDQN